MKRRKKRVKKAGKLTAKDKATLRRIMVKVRALRHP